MTPCTHKHLLIEEPNLRNLNREIVRAVYDKNGDSTQKAVVVGRLHLKDGQCHVSAVFFTFLPGLGRAVAMLTSTRQLLPSPHRALRSTKS